MAELITVAKVDSFVRENAAGQNYGNLAYLTVGGAGGASRLTYIFFPRPPLGATILSAFLYVKLREAWAGGPHTITASRILQAWKEGKIRWNNRPSITVTNQSTEAVTAGTKFQEIAIDVTDILQDAAGGGAFYGIRLEIDTTTARRFISAEANNPNNRPRLEVVYSFGPAGPSDQAPSGDRAVSLASGIHTWTFRHGQTEESQTEYQFQIDLPDGNFSSPVFDSGWVVSPESLIDLGATGFGGVPEGASRDKRVRVKDESGQESDWSEIERWKRVSKGTLTITAPANNLDPVEETTPPIIHSLSGATQGAHQHILYEEDENGNFAIIYDTGKEITGSNSWTPPSGLITRTDREYKVLVRVWDTVQRQSMPGDPAYLEAERTFVFVTSSVPSPVTSLVATALDVAVQLDIQRSSAPDYFALVVDGIIVEDRIDSADILVGGTSYRYIFTGAVPKATHLYEVQAVVLDGGVYKHSQGNDTDSIAWSPRGIWLTKAGIDGSEVLLYGDESQNLSIGVAGAIFYPGKKPVRHIRFVRGYEGSISGHLSKYKNTTALEFKTRLEDMVANHPREEIRLVMGDMNIPIIFTSDPRIRPRPGVPDDFEVDLDIAQSGEVRW